MNALLPSQGEEMLNHIAAVPLEKAYRLGLRA